VKIIIIIIIIIITIRHSNYACCWASYMVLGTMNGKLSAVGEEAVVICYGIHHVQRGEYRDVRASSGDVTSRYRNRTPVTVWSIKHTT